MCYSSKDCNHCEDTGQGRCCFSYLFYILRTLKKKPASFICLISNLKIPKMTSVKSGGLPRRNKIYLERFHYPLRHLQADLAQVLVPRGSPRDTEGTPSRLPKGDGLLRQIPSWPLARLAWSLGPTLRTHTAAMLSFL